MSTRKEPPKPVIASVDVEIQVVESKIRTRLIDTFLFLDRKLEKKRQLSDRDLVRLRTKLLGIALYLPPEFMPRAQFFDKVLTNLKSDYSWLKDPNHALLNDLLEEMQEIKKKHRKTVEELAVCRKKLRDLGDES